MTDRLLCKKEQEIIIPYNEVCGRTGKVDLKPSEG